MQTNINFSKYGKQFQESLAQMIMEDRPFADQIEEVLDASFFELKYLILFSKCSNLSNIIQIHFQNELPLILKCNVADLGDIKLCLAPQTDES